MPTGYGMTPALLAKGRGTPWLPEAAGLPLWMGATPDPEGNGRAAEPEKTTDGKAEAWTPPAGTVPPTETVGSPDGPTPPPTDGREVPTAAIELEATPDGPAAPPAADRVVPAAATELEATPEGLAPLPTPLPALDATIVGRGASLDTDTD